MHDKDNGNHKNPQKIDINDLEIREIEVEVLNGQQWECTDIYLDELMPAELDELTEILAYPCLVACREVIPNEDTPGLYRLRVLPGEPIPELVQAMYEDFACDMEERAAQEALSDGAVPNAPVVTDLNKESPKKVSDESLENDDSRPS